MITVEEIRAIALGLPRTYEKLVRDWTKFKVGPIVYLSVSPDETVLGFAYPKEQRAALIASEPDKFFPPVRSDERYNWVQVWLAKLDQAELRELIIDAWCMVVPKSVAAHYLTTTGQPVDARSGTGQPVNQTSDTRGESACPA